MRDGSWRFRRAETDLLELVPGGGNGVQRLAVQRSRGIVRGPAGYGLVASNVRLSDGALQLHGSLLAEGDDFLDRGQFVVSLLSRAYLFHCHCAVPYRCTAAVHARRFRRIPLKI